jgi:hypothetical protein
MCLKLLTIDMVRQLSPAADMSWRTPSAAMGPEITALPRQKNSKYRSKRELPAGCAEVLPIRVALMPTAGGHLQTLTTIFAGGIDEYGTRAVSPLVIGRKS